MPMKTTIRRGEVKSRPGTVDPEVYLRYCHIAIVNARAGRVQVCMDSVSVRVYKYGPAGNLRAFSDLRSPIEHGR